MHFISFLKPFEKFTDLSILGKIEEIDWSEAEISIYSM